MPWPLLTRRCERYPTAKKLGVTATPCRPERRGSRNYSRYWLLHWVLPEFIEKGVLSVRLCIHPSAARSSGS